jgi:hypothetical protein
MGRFIISARDNTHLDELKKILKEEFSNVSILRFALTRTDMVVSGLTTPDREKLEQRGYRVFDDIQFRPC